MTGSMAKADSDGEPIAIVGTGVAGVAAIINKLVDIAYNAKLNAPPVNLMVFDSRGPKPKGDTPYPFQDRRPYLLHPFYTEKPPPGSRHSENTSTSCLRKLPARRMPCCVLPTSKYTTMCSTCSNSPSGGPAQECS